MNNASKYERQGNWPIVQERFSDINFTLVDESGFLPDIQNYYFLLMADSDNSSAILIGSDSSPTFPIVAGGALELLIKNCNILYAEIVAGDKLHILSLGIGES